MANDERTATGVNKVLRDVLKRIDPEHRLEAFEVWNFWNDVVGSALARRAQPSAYRNGVLVVTVATHAWMQELQFMKDTLRDNLNARLGSNMIRDIYLVSGAVEVDEPPATEEIPQPAPRATIALPEISDPALAAAFRRLADAHARRSRRRNSR